MSDDAGFCLNKKSGGKKGIHDGGENIEDFLHIFFCGGQPKAGRLSYHDRQNNAFRFSALGGSPNHKW
jgi:hypothetical protein